MQKIFLLIFSRAEIIIQKNYKIYGKVAVVLDRGRPKNQIERNEKLTLRFSKFEKEKIARVAKQKNLTMTAAILKGIDLLERDKPKILRSQLNQQKNIQPKFEKISVGLIEGETVMFNKN